MSNIYELGQKLAHILGWKRKLRISEFSNSRQYWEERYRAGGTSGSGSYGRLAKFKSEVLNEFVRTHSIQSVIEFGCGDGNQLLYMNYPTYVGIDVSADALARAAKKFRRDLSKKFLLIGSPEFDRSELRVGNDLSLSLDVIYHLVEDEIFHAYMTDLFRASKKFVIVYASNMDTQAESHVRHRKFTDWVETNAPDWSLIDMIKNRYAYDPEKPDETSWADFYIFQRNQNAVG